MTTGRWAARWAGSGVAALLLVMGAPAEPVAADTVQVTPLEVGEGPWMLDAATGSTFAFEIVPPLGSVVRELDGSRRSIPGTVAAVDGRGNAFGAAARRIAPGVTDNRSHPVLLAPDGTVTELDTGSDHGVGGATAVGDDGTIVGIVSSPSTSWRPEPVAWTGPGHVWRALAHTADQPSSPTAVSAHGLAVGFNGTGFGIPDSDHSWHTDAHAVSWDIESGAQTLLDEAGGAASRALQINGRGEIFGIVDQHYALWPSVTARPITLGPVDAVELRDVLDDDGRVLQALRQPDGALHVERWDPATDTHLSVLTLAAPDAAYTSGQMNRTGQVAIVHRGPADVRCTLWSERWGATTVACDHPWRAFPIDEDRLLYDGPHPAIVTVTHGPAADPASPNAPEAWVEAASLARAILDQPVAPPATGKVQPATAAVTAPVFTG